MRKLRWLPVGLVILFASLACSLTGGWNNSSGVSDEAMKATVAVMQQTIDAARFAAEQTAQVWMTEQSFTSATVEGGAGTAIPYGAISGTVSFPSEVIPALRLVAFNTASDAFVALELAAGSGDYRMDFVPPGTYELVAYPLEGFRDAPVFAGAYTRAVACGLDVSCTDHSLIAFEVRAGEETVGIDPADWYAPPGTFPPDPTR